MRARSGDQRGVVAVVVALVTAMVLVPLAGLAVDLGVQRVARRDMQSLADVIALDLARQLDGVTTVKQWASRTPSLQTLADQSRDRNQSTVGSTPVVTPTLGLLVADGSFSALPLDSTSVPTAVQVVVGASVSFRFMPGAGSVARSAIGIASSSACFKMGSYAAAIKSGNAAVLQPLGSILGGLNLSLLSYQGMANATVTLAQLAADSHIGTADRLLTGNVAVADLIQATIDVLTPGGAQNSTAISALQSILTITAGLSTPTIPMTKLLSVAPTDAAALHTKFDVLDLIAGAVLVADGQHAIDIPNLWAGVAGTGHTADASLYVQQGASTACGAPNSVKAQADNSQVSGFVKFDQMNSPSINLGYANLKTAPGTGRLDVNIAPAHGQLVAPPAVHCGANTSVDPTTFSVAVSSSLASLSLTTQIPVTGSVSLAGIGVVDLNLLVDVNVATTKPSGSGTANLAIPPNDNTGIPTGSPTRLNPATASVSIDTSSTASVVGVPLPLSTAALAPTLSGVVDAVTNTFVPMTVNPLVGNINDLLMGPVAALLGLDIGGADVFGIGATCAAPQLAG